MTANMLEQVQANVGMNLRFYRRNRLLAGVALLFIVISLLYVGGAILFATSTGRFDLTRMLFGELQYFAFVFVAATGLVLVAVQVRGKAVKLIFTKPCPPHVWLASAFFSAIVLALFLYAAIAAIAYVLLAVWRIPIQGGFAFMAIKGFFEAVSAMAYLTFLSMIMHPVIAVLIAVVFNESIFLAMRTGLIAAIKNTGGNVILPLLEKGSYAFYMLTPMFSPYEEKMQTVATSLRVSGGEWRYLVYAGAYSIALTILLYFLTLIALERKNFI